MIQYIILVISLLIIFLWNPVEHMTNADVAKKMQFHASNPLKWDTIPSKSTHKKAGNGQQIYGPEVPAPGKDEPEPAPPTKGNGTQVEYVYPTVLGPEQRKLPLRANAETSPVSDDALGESYVPANEFPAGPAEPMPYLNNFSKILNDN